MIDGLLAVAYRSILWVPSPSENALITSLRSVGENEMRAFTAIVLAFFCLFIVSSARATESTMLLSETVGALHEGQASAEPFGLSTEKVFDEAILSRWLELEEQLRREDKILASCDEDMSS